MTAAKKKAIDLPAQAKIVKYSNRVVRASQRLSLAEQRIILSAISQVPDRAITIDDKFYITADDYEKLCPGIKAEYVYHEMKKAVETLFHRFVSEDIVKDNEIVGKSVWHWVSTAEYLDKEGRVAVQFNYKMIPHINRLKKNFTLYKLNEITGFRSAYTQPLYARLMIFMRDPETKLRKQTWTDYIKLDELRKILDAQRYDNFTDFKRRVLDIAIKQINESLYTQFRVKYEISKKERKRITELKFIMRYKAQQLESEPDPVEDTLDMFTGLTTRQATLTEKQIAMYADKLTDGGSTQVQSEIGEKFWQFVSKKFKKDPTFSITFGQTDGEGYRDWVAEKLENPEFVQLIYDPFLKALEFKPSR